MILNIEFCFQRLIYSCTGPVDRDYDDLRRFHEAGAAGVKRAFGAGARSPLLMVQGSLPGGSETDVRFFSLSFI